MELIEYPDREVLNLELAQIVAEELAGAIRARGAATLCLPGGSTPAPFMSALSAAAIPWEHVSVLPGDERLVDEEHNRSNARLIRRHLLDGRGAAARLVPLYDPADADPAAGAAARIAPILPLSSLVLGMGTDLHVASLFPGAEGLAAVLAPGAPVVAAMRAPDGEARLTLTLPVLSAVARAHLLVTGADKRSALDRAGELDPLQAPVRALWPGLTVHWAE